MKCSISVPVSVPLAPAIAPAVSASASTRPALWELPQRLNRSTDVFNMTNVLLRGTAFRTTVWCLSAAVLAMAFVAPANATLSSSSVVDVSDPLNGNARDAEEVRSDTASVVTSGAALDNGFIRPNTFAEATYGTLRTSSFADSEVPDDGATQMGSSATSTAGWSESVTPLIPGVQLGTPGTLTYQMRLTGGFSKTDAGISSPISYTGQGTIWGGLSRGAQAAFNAGFTSDPPTRFVVERNRVQVYYDDSISVLGITGYPINEVIEGTLRFSVGVPITLEAFLITGATARSNSPGGQLSFTAAAGNTLAWGGFTNVVLDDLSLSTAGFTAIGQASGLDFATPVPEPHRVALFGLGLALLMWRRKLAV